MECLSSRREREAPGGRARENRKFIQAPSPEIWSETISGGEEVLAGEGGGLFLGYLLGKNFRRRDRDHLVLPRRMDAAVCRAEVCYAFGREYGRHRAVRLREFITLLGGAAAALAVAPWGRAPRIQPYLRRRSRGPGRGFLPHQTDEVFTHTGDPVFPGADAIRAVSAGRFMLSDVRPPHITSRIRCRFPSLARWES